MSLGEREKIIRHALSKQCRKAFRGKISGLTWRDSAAYVIVEQEYKNENDLKNGFEQREIDSITVEIKSDIRN